jgi:hypothetical protein
MSTTHPLLQRDIQASSQPVVVDYKALEVPKRHTPSDGLLMGEREQLSLYIEGWSEADPVKIANATVDDYDFHDPLVGHFSKHTLPQYFSLLRSRFATSVSFGRCDPAFILRGPFSPCDGVQRGYWREAPVLGLTGTAQITVTRRGVAAEAVVYDLNIACDALRAISRTAS